MTIQYVSVTFALDTNGELIDPADAYAMLAHKLKTVPLSLTDLHGQLWNVSSVYDNSEPYEER